MTKEELAKLLDGREDGSEITDAEAKQAKESGLVVAFGYSDDNVELRGAISEEISCYDGGSFYVTPEGMLKNKCESEECPYFEKMVETAWEVAALWCKEKPYAWTYSTELPHATFEIVKDGEKYCRGIVFEMPKEEFHER